MYIKEISLMRKLKRVASSILCVLMCSVLLCGCSILDMIGSLLQDNSETQLSAPVITLDTENEKITWPAIADATSYYVYCNSGTTPVDEVKYSVGLTTYQYIFSSILEESGQYAFYVIASSTSPSFLDSNRSNIVSYEYTKLDKLSTPSVTLDGDAKTISWSTIENATAFDIYCNGTKVDTVLGSVTTYDFSECVTTYAVYKFAVVAVGDGVEYKNSRESRSVRYIYSDIDIYEADTDSYIYGAVNSPSATISDTTLSWSEVDDADSYVVSVYHNDLEYISTNVEDVTSFDISKLLFEEGVYAVRVGASVDDDIIMSNMLYYNTKDYGTYTNNSHIYAFDGQLNDYYIEDYDELCNMAYYQFIKRNEDFNIRLSGHYVDEIKEDTRYKYKRNSDGSYTSVKLTRTLDKVNMALEDAFSSFLETCYYNYGYGSTFSQKVGTNDYEYRIRLNFYGVYECDTDIPVITVKDQFDYVPFYDTYVGTGRSDTYDEFYSDDKFITTYVTTSEDLFWAVTYGYTPIFISETCMAKVIYDKAKEVLQDIIYEEMTDYEKALAIFDWISLNTQYDHSDYNDIGTNGYTESLPGYYFTEHACFYLEGVFVTGVSVCDGFSKAFALMCNMEGIDCIRVVGSVSSGLHAWNKVCIDGEWYVVDITWTESDSLGDEVFFHTYFLVSDSYIARTHVDYQYRESYDEYPAEHMYNYYAHRYLGGYSGNALYDHVIVSDEELATVLDYVMQNSIDTIEFVIDCSSYIVPTYVDSYGVILNEIYTKMRANKFASQYLQCINWGSYIKYSDTAYGIVFTIDVTLLIDSVENTATTVNEIDNIVDYAIENNLYGEYEIYVVREILDEYLGDGMTITQAFDAMVDDLKDSGDVFNYTITPMAEGVIEYSEGEEGYHFYIVIDHSL